MTLQDEFLFHLIHSAQLYTVANNQPPTQNYGVHTLLFVDALYYHLVMGRKTAIYGIQSHARWNMAGQSFDVNIDTAKARPG